MIRDITLGQFFPGDSVIHRMDSRIKLVLTFGLIIFVFIATSAVSAALLIAAVLALMVLTQVPMKVYLRGLKPILIIVLFTAVLNIFYVKTGTVLVQWKFILITTDGLLRCARIAIRIAVMVLLSSALTYTTSPTDLTDALEHLMKPLRKIRVPVHEIAMMMTIALRFVPTLLDETDKITSAQKARGADLESGNLLQRMRAMIPILIPLFVSAFRRAFDLAMAMECRCYHGGDGRTSMKQPKLHRRDYIALAVSVVFCVGVVLCNRIPPQL